MNQQFPSPAPKPPASLWPKWRFQLWHVLYATAVFASAISLMGGWGAIVGVVVCLFWTYVYGGTEHTGPYRLLQATIAVLLFGLLCTCLVPQVGIARRAVRRMQCANNLKQISLGMLNYENAYGCLPPAVVYAEDGTPMHSWRVLIAPFMGDQRVWQAYRFDEPWDSPHNSKLMDLMPPSYRCPTSHEWTEREGAAFETNYCVVVNERSCFPPRGSRKLAEIEDGMASTILVVEFDGPGIPWMAPVDPGLDEYLDHYARWGPEHPPKHSYETRFERVFTGEQIAFADGSVHFLGTGLPRDALRQMIRVDDGVFAFDDWHSWGAYRQIRWDGYISLTALIALSLLPVLGLRRSSPTADEC